MLGTTILVCVQYLIPIYFSVLFYMALCVQNSFFCDIPLFLSVVVAMVVNYLFKFSTKRVTVTVDGIRQNTWMISMNFKLMQQFLKQRRATCWRMDRWTDKPRDAIIRQTFVGVQKSSILNIPITIGRIKKSFILVKRITIGRIKNSYILDIPVTIGRIKIFHTR